MIIENVHKKFNRKIKIRRGSDAQRKLVVFEESEPIFVKDTKRIYAGDQKTYGGKVQTHTFFITENNNVPINSLPFDIVYNKVDKLCYAIDGFGKLVLIFPDTTGLVNSIQKDIDDLNVLFYRLSTEVCNDTLALKTDKDINIVTDNQIRIKVKEYEG
jgi:hypothetical protein